MVLEIISIFCSQRIFSCDQSRIVEVGQIELYGSVKLEIRELLNKEQTGFKEPFIP